MSDSSYYITVLHGANEGAKVDFDKNSFSIGSTDDCDLILSGFPVAEKRLIISFENDKFFIKAINGSLYLDATEVHVEDDFILFKPYQIIDIDGCRLTVGKAGEELPDNIEQKKYSKILQESHDEMLVSAFRKLKPKDPERNFIIPKTFISLLALMVAGGVFFVSAKATSESQLENLGKDQNDQNDVEAHAFALNQKLPLRLSSKTTGEKINNDSDTIQNAIKEAYLLLRTYGVNRINLHLDKTGLLSAKGYVGNAKSWEKAKTSILGDIDAITDIDETEVETLEERSVALNKLLKNKNLKSDIVVDVKQNRNSIKVSGEITHNDFMQWEKVKSIFLQENGNEPIIEEDIIDIEEKIHLSIRSVSVGKTAFFVSEAGKKYMVGSDLGNGYQVAGIEKNKIILQYKGKKISIFYNQLMKSDTQKTIRS